MKRSGYTILELLVVLGIVGILLVEGGPSYVSWSRAAVVREAAVDLSVNITRARTSAKRENTPWTLEVTGAHTYQLGPTGGHMTTFTLPDTVMFTTTATRVEFVAPHGTLPTGTVSVPAFVLRHLADTSKTRTVKVVSLIGEVVIQ